MTTAIPYDHSTPVDRRALGWFNYLQRAGNTVLLFFLNPVLDPDTNRLSGTRLMAVTMVCVDVFDIVQSHRLQELAITKGTVDAIDIHNIELFGLAVLTWFGKLGLDTTVALVKAWRGKDA